MAQPAVADVRVSCPACGGPIHPIAGRCKHCKVDLVSIRGGATGAQGTLISIGGLGGTRTAPAPALVTPRAATPTAIPTSAPAPSAPIAALPSLGGGALSPAIAPAATAAPVFAPIAASRSGWSRRWPLLVAAVAAIAIIVSVAILVFGGDDPKQRRRRTLGPAPDRMQTDSLPTDPWARQAQPGSGASLDTTPVPPPVPAPDISPDDPPPPANRVDDDDEEDGVVGGVAGGVVGGVVGGPIDIPDVHTPGEFTSAAVDVGCQRVTACWGDVPEAKQVCDQAKAMLAAQRDQVTLACPRLDTDNARQCLRQLSSLPCPEPGTTVVDLVSMVVGLGACTRACE